MPGTLALRRKRRNRCGPTSLRVALIDPSRRGRASGLAASEPICEVAGGAAESRRLRTLPPTGSDETIVRSRFESDGCRRNDTFGTRLRARAQRVTVMPGIEAKAARRHDVHDAAPGDRLQEVRANLERPTGRVYRPGHPDSSNG